MNAVNTPAYVLRHMAVADLNQVAAIDRASFEQPWPPGSFYHEVTQSFISHMLVLERVTLAHPGAPQRLWLWLSGRGDVDEITWREVVGAGGLWVIKEEAHISTIAIDPAYRGQGLGEVLLVAMIRRGLAMGAAYLVLEVRVRNKVAQNLYHKYGFQVVDTRHSYYQDGEDAYLMQLDFDRTFAANWPQLVESAEARCVVLDQYSTTRHPRLGEPVYASLAHHPLFLAG
jgi:[ribosomal protein S18]-alanine N-acetyltransferase